MSRISSMPLDLTENPELSSGEDSDYENSRDNDKPPRKKAKTESSASGSTESSAATVPRRKKNLSLLPNMPLDILFEVFSHLSPKDIIHLSRTTRIFRDTLMRKSSSSVWRTARDHFGAPECPSILSEPQWAVLLFMNNCELCDTKNVQTVEFSLLRRVCIPCKRGNYLPESKMKTEFPEVDAEFLELIPSTTLPPASHNRRNARFFWTPDIFSLAQKLLEYEYKVYIGIPGAKAAREEFKARRKEMVKSIHQCRHERELWEGNLACGRYVDRRGLIEQRFNAIQEKFIELGYVPDDMIYIRSKRECKQPALLTERIWKRIRPILEPLVVKEKQERLKRELAESLSSRRSIIHTLYQEYHKTVAPAQWKYLPRTLELCAMEPFEKVLNFSPEVKVSAGDFVDAFRELPTLLAGYFNARKVHARSLLQLPVSSPKDSLDLATAAFTCSEDSCTLAGTQPKSYLFGWDDFAQHHCKPDFDSLSKFDNRRHWNQQRVKYTPDPSNIVFSPQGSEVAGVVVRAAGFDERVVTVEDMDGRDVRFGCAVCPPREGGGGDDVGQWVKVGYRWRDFISHCTTHSHTPDRALIVLPHDVAEIVKSNEMTDPNRAKSQWTCAHCTIYLGDLQLREVVIGHLRLLHGIDSPYEPEDLFQFSRSQSGKSFEATYPVRLVASVETGWNTLGAWI